MFGPVFPGPLGQRIGRATTTVLGADGLISRAVAERASDSTDDRLLCTRHPKSRGLVWEEILELKVKAPSFDLRPQPEPQGP